MKVKYSYLKEQFKDYQSIFKKIARVVETGDYTLGLEVADFEEKFALFKIGRIKFNISLEFRKEAVYCRVDVIDPEIDTGVSWIDFPIRRGSMDICTHN